MGITGGNAGSRGKSHNMVVLTEDWGAEAAGVLGNDLTYCGSFDNKLTTVWKLPFNLRMIFITKSTIFQLIMITFTCEINDCQYNSSRFVLSQNHSQISKNVSSDTKEGLLLIQKNAFSERHLALKSSYKSPPNITSPFSLYKVIKYTPL